MLHKKVCDDIYGCGAYDQDESYIHSQQKKKKKKKNAENVIGWRYIFYLTSNVVNIKSEYLSCHQESEDSSFHDVCILFSTLKFLSLFHKCLVIWFDLAFVVSNSEINVTDQLDVVCHSYQKCSKFKFYG